jgi:hypothetical protein
VCLPLRALYRRHFRITLWCNLGQSGRSRAHAWSTVMPVTFTNYLEQISHNLDAHDGPRLAYLLRVTGPHVKDLLREFKNPTVSTINPVILCLGEESGRDGSLADHKSCSSAALCPDCSPYREKETERSVQRAYRIY